FYYSPFGEELVEQEPYNADYNSPYHFNAKEVDPETGYHYYGARYYNSNLSVWLSVDPMADQAPGWTPYRFCFNNPVMLVDPNGMFESIHTDESGNIIAEYDDGDDGVYMHANGTTKADIDQQRASAGTTYGNGDCYGELGSNIDISVVMENKLNQSSAEAKDIDTKLGYAAKVGPYMEWDLKNNESTIFGIAWEHDENTGDKTTFSFGPYSGMNAADVGNYHAGYTGRYTRGGEGMSYMSLWKGAGVAESFKQLGKGHGTRFISGMMQAGYLPTPGWFPTTPPYGDGERDFMWNTQGMSDADKTK
ncbi:MAG: RHS repeat-associated core domain-containing protein, partial [Flavobacteriales bacterium]|nr:RHS repeat-associated core domain-containing protein [Flavobacteriales bacterium]